MTPKKPITHAALASWPALNAFLMDCRDQDVIERLIEAELHGRRRAQFLRRLQSRLNRLRNQEATAALEAHIK